MDMAAHPFRVAKTDHVTSASLSTGVGGAPTGNWVGSYLQQDNGWHHVTASLSLYAGRVMDHLAAGVGTPIGQGRWDVWIANMVIARADGSVRPLVTGQPVIGSIWNPCGGHDFVFATESTPVHDAVNTTYYLADHLGSTQMELTSGGWPVWQGQFTHFGQEIVAGNTLLPDTADGSSGRYKFTGKEEIQNQGPTTSGQDTTPAAWGGDLARLSAQEEPVPYAKWTIRKVWISTSILATIHYKLFEEKPRGELGDDEEKKTYKPRSLPKS